MDKQSQKLTDAINLLKKIVKFSHLEGQKHIDLALAKNEERASYMGALKVVTWSIEAGDISKEDFETQVGLN